MKTKFQKNLKRATYWMGVVVLGIILGVSLQFAQAWTAPSATAPDGNVYAPVNIGNSVQFKSAPFGVNGQSGTYGQTYLKTWGLLSMGDIYIEPKSGGNLHLTTSAWDLSGAMRVGFGTTTFDGNVGIGIGNTGTPIASKGASGYLDVRDVYIRDIGKWASELTSTTATGCVYTYSDWSTCTGNTQTRTVSTDTPAGCSNDPITTRSCDSSSYCNGVGYDPGTAWCDTNIGKIYSPGEWVPLVYHNNSIDGTSGTWSNLDGEDITIPFKMCSFEIVDEWFDNSGFVALFDVNSAQRLALWSRKDLQFDQEFEYYDEGESWAAYWSGVSTSYVRNGANIQNGAPCNIVSYNDGKCNTEGCVDFPQSWVIQTKSPYLDGGSLNWCGHITGVNDGSYDGNNRVVGTNVQPAGTRLKAYSSHANGSGGNWHKYTIKGQICGN